MSDEDQKPQLEGLTIMIAEDDELPRRELKDMLAAMKMEVIVASNGNEALRLQEAFDGEIDFLLTDIRMPQMDGMQLGDAFSRARPQSNVIYMSGFAPPGFHLYDHTFLPKPLQEDDVRKILERALQRRDEREKPK